MKAKPWQLLLLAGLGVIAVRVAVPFCMYWRIAGLYEIYWYGWWWLPFVAIAYCSTRCVGWLGFIATLLIVSIVILLIDVDWIFKDMREHPENGRDADFVFGFGVLCRIVLFNVLLVPIGILGRWARARRRQLVNETKVDRQIAAANLPSRDRLK